MTLAELLAAGTKQFNQHRRQRDFERSHAGATLAQLFFANADLSGLDLSNAEFDECTVSDSSFRGSDLSGAYLHGGRFERCDFRDVQLEGASFERVEFVECDFTGAKELGSVELLDVVGLGVLSAATPALAEEPRFIPGHVAVNEALERELEAHPEETQRWLVYGDWLQSEGDLRGELVVRQQRGDGFAAFVDDHVEQLFPGCADEVRGGGQNPELSPEWRHGFVHGVTLASLNRDRRVDLGELASRVLPLPVCRFLRRLSFGLTWSVFAGPGEANDYAPVVERLVREPLLSRITTLEFGLQERAIDPDYGEEEALEPFGDLSALWAHVPWLRQLRVVGSEGALGELMLPELRELALEYDYADSLVDEVIAARLPKLERLELCAQRIDLEPLLHVLSSSRVTQLAFPRFPDAGRIFEALLDSPLLARLKVLDLRGAELRGTAFEVLRKNLRAFSHLQRLDLTDALDPHEEEALSRLGDFIVLKAPEDRRPLEDDGYGPGDWDDDDWFTQPEPEEPLEPVAPNADLDIPDEFGD
ncbi:MAG: pentapeptide repeat-containing protein [Myxococcota bacterium]